MRTTAGNAAGDAGANRDGQCRRCRWCKPRQAVPQVSLVLLVVVLLLVKLVLVLTSAPPLSHRPRGTSACTACTAQQGAPRMLFQVV